MQAIVRLLSLQDSPVTEALRQGLSSLTFSLRAAVQQSPCDPGVHDGKQLLEQLTVLLQTEQRQPGSIVRGGSALQQPASAIQQLRAEIEKSAPLQDRLGPIRLQGTTEAEIWGEVQRLLLRLNPAEAQHWSDRARTLLGETADDGPCAVLSDDVEDVIYPGSRTIPGLRVSPAAPRHPLLREQTRSQILDDSELAACEAYLSFYLHYMDLDPNLHHALATIRPLGIHPLTGIQREAFTRELTQRFDRLHRTAHHPVDSLLAWIAFDEAVHSLIYLPLAGRLSWWQQHHQRSRQRLDTVAQRARRAGHRVHVRWLTGMYRQVRTYSANDWGLETGGNAGEVLACLRVYAEIDGRTFPGRVIYRDC